MGVCKPQEYILKIGDIDSITPTVVKALEVLKDHFTIITTGRSLKPQSAGFIWNFERIEINNLSRPNTLRLTHYLCQELGRTRNISGIKSGIRRREILEWCKNCVADSAKSPYSTTKP